VRVELVVPPAATHVIGDHTPLIWRFTNLEPEPVAFMWEGCCRLNGRLDVTAPGSAFTPVPPGEALAHMFAKAEILEPGRRSDFETRISDWVRLHDTGTYELRGRYTGVLPEQTPQVPPSLALWRASASTSPIELSVLSVADYLAQRADRAAQRSIDLVLDGPARLDPLDAAPLRLDLRNTGTVSQRIVWPNDLQLWIVDPDGARLGFLPLPVDGPYEEIALAPGQTVRREIPFGPGRLEGERFDSYTVFVDLQPAPDQPRVPSNPLGIRWELDVDDVHQLVLRAAGGPAMGLRNPALRLLRVHLADVADQLAAIDLDPAPARARALRDQLRFAACLKPLGPEPGRVDLALSIPSRHPAELSDPILETCMDLLPSSARVSADRTFEAVLAVRRHLGWDLALNLVPHPDTRVETIQAALGPFDRFATVLATAPRALLMDGTTNAPPAVVFRSQPIPAGLLVRLSVSDDAVRRELARKAPALFPLPQATLFRPEEIRAARFEAIRDDDELAALLDGTRGSLQTLVLADPILTWTELLDALAPFLSRRLTVTVTTAAPGP
jgi:hypothetical protein